SHGGCIRWNAPGRPCQAYTSSADAGIAERRVKVESDMAGVRGAETKTGGAQKKTKITKKKMRETRRARVDQTPFFEFCAFFWPLLLFAGHSVLIPAMNPPRITVANLYADLAASVVHFRADVSAVERSRKRVEAALADGRPHYGVNTGFGALARERVPDDQLA